MMGYKQARRNEPLRCYVVDDHCDALRYIHGGIRSKALPFDGFRMMHWDAHPDLMVTPDMPAATCFKPQQLYEALETSEGGIAEWILPLVFQGHLHHVWWIRPRWANQFTDGKYRFHIGQVEATGFMRVDSTASYFVDDRLYCHSTEMKRLKPLDLDVSTARHALEGVIGSSTAAFTCEESKDSGICEEGEWPCERPASFFRCTETKLRKEQLANGNYSIEAADTREDDSICRGKPIPWVLDICLDYFTTNNPFMSDIEEKFGHTDAELIRSFFVKPLFRGTDTTLTHAQQLEHEQIFKHELEVLLKGGTDALRAASGSDDNARIVAAESHEHEERANRIASDVNRDHAEVRSAAVAVEEQPNISDSTLGRLARLYPPDPDHQALPHRFASLVRRSCPEKRGMIAWVDHCVGLPRFLASRQQIDEAILTTEKVLKALIESKTQWGCPPALVIIARSEGDGYVPADIAEVLETEVLTMLIRLLGGQDGSDFEVLYHNGLEARSCVALRRDAEV